MSTEIKTLQNPSKTKAYLPRTCLKAVADKNGDYISEDVLASDINDLKNGAISSLNNATELNDTLTFHTENFTIQYIFFIKRAGWCFCSFAATRVNSGGYAIAIEGLPRCAMSGIYFAGTGGVLAQVYNEDSVGKIQIRQDSAGQQFFLITYPIANDVS